MNIHAGTLLVKISSDSQICKLWDIYVPSRFTDAVLWAEPVLGVAGEPCNATLSRASHAVGCGILCFNTGNERTGSNGKSRIIKPTGSGCETIRQPLDCGEARRTLAGKE